MSLLGHTIPDPVGVFLGTRYLRFESPIGLQGLARPTGERLDVLAVYSGRSRSGRLRAFIAAAKLEYRTICVWHIDNPIVHDALLRYGFTPEVQIDEFGEVLKGLRWDKP